MGNHLDKTCYKNPLIFTADSLLRLNSEVLVAYKLQLPIAKVQVTMNGLVEQGVPLEQANNN
jgi:hypothetical protein